MQIQALGFESVGVKKKNNNKQTNQSCLAVGIHRDCVWKPAEPQQLQGHFLSPQSIRQVLKAQTS